MTSPAYSVELPSDDRPTALVSSTLAAPPISVAPELIERLLRDHGAILLRGFGFDVAGFRAFAERLCVTAVSNESPDRRLIEPGTAIQTVNLGVDPFPLHPELSREPWRPDVCLFACFDPPARGGETTLCDGAAIVRRLPAAIAEAMSGRRLLYIQEAGPALLGRWLGSPTPGDALLAAPPPACPYWFRRVGERIVRGFSRPLLQRSLFGDEPVFGNFLLFARDYLGRSNIPLLDDGSPVPAAWLDAVRAAAEPITYAHGWRQGDLVLLDNSRFMHGRRAILDPRARRIASYFGYLACAPPQPDEPLDPVWRRAILDPPPPLG